MPSLFAIALLFVAACGSGAATSSYGLCVNDCKKKFDCGQNTSATDCQSANCDQTFLDAEDRRLSAECSNFQMVKDADHACLDVSCTEYASCLSNVNRTCMKAN